VLKCADYKCHSGCEAVLQRLGDRVCQLFDEMSYLCSHGVMCIQLTSTDAALRESLKPFSTDVLCMD
jgi:hypothetical protein